MVSGANCLGLGGMLVEFWRDSGIGEVGKRDTYGCDTDGNAILFMSRYLNQVITLKCEFLDLYHNVMTATQHQAASLLLVIS